jgi:hypothetical protein
MFAKVYTQIFDSSIAEDYTVRHVFMDLLVLADSEGVVDMTQAAIARRTNVPLDKIKAAMKVLSEPDPDSRSEAEEGRRIALVDPHRDWGWRIINYEHYRRLRDEEARRSYHREHMRKYRKRVKNGEDDVINSGSLLRPVKTCDALLTHAEAEEEETPKSPNAPASPALKRELRISDNPALERAAKLFRYTDRRTLDRKEIAAWKQAKTAVEETTEEQWQALEWYYASRDAEVTKFRIR